jgi:Short-chain alcohol dehydrogenase of unknown specificity
MPEDDPSTLLLTGASSAIGRSIAHRFARYGWQIGLLDSNDKALDQLKEELAGAAAVTTYAVEPTDEAAVRHALEDFSAETGGQLRVLVNATGVMRSGRFEDLDLETHREQLNGNLWAMLVVTHAAFPLLRDTDRARVISIASASSMYGTPDLASYSAAKAGVRSLTQSLNLEWSHHDIHVCDVVPPYVDAPADEADDPALQMPPRRLGPNLMPEDITDVVQEAVTEDRIHWPVGKQFRWIYRLSDVLPASLVRLLMRYVSGF